MIKKLFRRLRLVLLRGHTLLYAWCYGIEVGRGTIIHRGAVVRRHDGGRVKLGARCEIARGAMLLTYGGDITVGDDCSVQPYSVLYGHGGLTIGNGVRLATHVVVVPANHNHHNIDRPIFKQGVSAKGIYIQDDVWVASGARILDGVTIASGCVVAAGAVVVRSTEPRGVYGGVPARRLKSRISQAAEGRT